MNTPSTTPLVSSVPLNAGQFVCSVVCRVLQGFAAVTVVLVAIRFADDSTLGAMNAYLCIAAALCGAGLTTVFERAMKPLLGVQSGCVLTALCTVVGVSLLGGDASLFPASCFIGIGIGTDWSSCSEVARRSLPTKLRWRGIRIWAVSFALGAAIAIAVRNNVSLVSWIPAALSVISLLLLLVAKPLQTERPVTEEIETRPAAPQLPATPSAMVAPEVGNTGASNETEECDAAECCGGGVREILPTGFWHGVLLAVIGLLSFYLTLCHLCESRFFYADWSLTTFAVGLPTGYLLMISTAPRIGYIVALLPCLLFGMVSVVMLQLCWSDSQWTSFVTFCCGLFSAAVFCGVNSVVGEIFSDCPTDAKRSRVLSVAAFASSALMVAFAAVRTIRYHDTIMTIVWPAVFAGGLLAIRSLPSPVISSLGSDDESNSEDEELNDVLSALNESSSRPDDGDVLSSGF